MTARRGGPGDGPREAARAAPRAPQAGRAVHPRHLRRRRSPAPQADAVALPSDGRRAPARRLRRHQGGARAPMTDDAFRSRCERRARRPQPERRRARPGGLGPVRAASALRPGRPRRPGHLRRAAASGWRQSRRARPRQRRPALLPRDSAQRSTRRPSTSSGRAASRPRVPDPKQRPWVRIIIEKPFGRAWRAPAR